MLALMLLAPVVAVAQVSMAQLDPRVEALLARLQSTSINTRIAAAQDVFGGGFASPELYAKLAERIEQGLAELQGPDRHANELAWQTKALASSGDVRYLPLIERVENAGHRRLAGHAHEAKQVLFRAVESGRPYLLPLKVPLISDAQAQQCELLAQENCQTRRPVGSCVVHHQNRAILVGGNAIQLMHSTSRSTRIQETRLANLYRCRW
jgi:hypothetical protein